MITDTEGIVLRQVKTTHNRRMILLFSKKYGKISAGTGITEKAKGKSSLALRPFSYSRYELHKGRDSYNINSAQLIESHYKIGEDVDKYMNGAYVLEFTEKVLYEEAPSVPVFNLLRDFLEILEHRDKGIGTLVLAYQIKLFKLMGVMPVLDRCAVCGQKKEINKFIVEEGGTVCSDCYNENKSAYKLIYDAKFGIVDILKYFADNPLNNLENIALTEEKGKLLREIVVRYAAQHLSATGLKSERLI